MTFPFDWDFERCGVVLRSAPSKFRGGDDMTVDVSDPEVAATVPAPEETMSWASDFMCSLFHDADVEERNERNCA